MLLRIMLPSGSLCGASDLRTGVFAANPNSDQAVWAGLTPCEKGRPLLGKRPLTGLLSKQQFTQLDYPLNTQDQ